MEYLSIDDIFNIIGQFGWNQRLYCIGFSVLQFFLAFHMLLNVFTGLDPTFKCFARDGSSKNEPLINQCIEDTPQKCSLTYTTEYKSFASEWNLICNEKYKVALVQSIWMGGVMTGALVLGGVADVIGRLKTLMMALLGTIAFEGFSAFAPTLVVMAMLRYLGGICCALVILVSFVFSQELVGMDWRSFCGIFIAMSFAVGIGVFSALASVMDTWRTLTFICSVSGIVFLILPCYIPESPRWLASQGRNDEAKEILEGMARRNGKFSNLPTNWEISVTGNSKDESDKKPQGVGLLVSHPYVLLLTLIQIYSWFVNSATYYGLTIAASNLGGDAYVSTALSGLIEIPACVVAIGIIDRIGRRLTLCGFMMIGGSACLCIQFLPVQFVNVKTLLALCGKLSISASFSVCYIHSAEIFPTAIRNSGMGIVSVAARVGGMLAPLILMLGDVLPNLQFTALGIMTFVAGVLNLKLPETLGQPMPESVADILALRNLGKTGCSIKDYQYNKLETGEEETDTEVIMRPRSPFMRGKITSEDQVCLIEEE
ncbi:solute carrier family 22 member 15-like isoform X2 [Cherax quadricarinatus]|nr:solute carrier family 22 member 15-like isoform X3 [Cherax quadricarinatus]XP_053628987.1 solute carrier family 22 member 15-like isoform X3 [Cherax quadricarinatus]XP_053628988.1 solute carrier family 22 member 15-like isoform X3 [Cherax quadricarinatus]